MTKNERTMLIHHYFSRGLKLVPVDKDKVPTVKSWSEDISENEFFEHTGDVAIISGKRSGGVECIDIDCKYDLTGKLYDDYVNALYEENSALLKVLVIQKTVNKGYHFIYRCETVGGNMKLASRETTAEEREKDPHQKIKVLLETRGEGGYFLIPPSKGYEIIQGSLLELPMISATQRELMLSLARMVNQVIPEKKPDPKPKKTPAPANAGYGSELQPGEDYGNRGDVVELLKRHGWSEAQKQSSEQVYLKRPGDTKSKYGGVYHHEKQSFYVFTTSSEFNPNESYSPMGVYAILECGGDYEEAARQLGKDGYGSSHHSKPAAPSLPEQTSSDYLYEASAGDELLYKTVRGTLEMGKKFGVRSLDRYLRYKKNQYLLVVSNQNVGKTFFVLWLLSRLAIEYEMKFLILVMENDVGQAKRDLAQFYLNTMIKRTLSEAKVKTGLEFVNKYFKFLNTTKHRYSYVTALDAGRKIHKEWPYDGFFIDPYNALRIDTKAAGGIKGYDYHLEGSNEIQFFTKSCVSVILSCHITTEAARSGRAPTINDVQGGMSFTAKAHDGIVLYRNLQDKYLKYITEVSVSKLKDRQTGGDWTPYDYPVRLKLVLNPSFGFVEEGSIEWKASEGDELPDNIEATEEPPTEGEEPLPKSDVPF